MKTQSHAFHAFALAPLPMAVALHAGAALDLATDAEVILAIAPAPSIAQPGSGLQCKDLPPAILSAHGDQV
jgi:hypothetical protein